MRLRPTLAASVAVAASAPGYLSGLARARLRTRTTALPEEVPLAEHDALPTVMRELKPAILRGYLRHFEFYDLFQPDVLRDAFADQVVATFVNEPTDPGFEQQSQVTRVRLGVLLDAVFGSEPDTNRRYYSRWGGPATVPRLELRKLDTGKPFRNCSLWLGQEGNITPIHWDSWHGFLGMIEGRKSVTLFPPEEVYSLYPRHFFSRSYNESRVSRLPNDYRDADPARFPRVASTRRFEATLEPGDVLYIPPGWWHQVISLEGALSVAFRYGAKGRELPTTTRLQIAWVFLLNATGISPLRSLGRETGVSWPADDTADILRYRDALRTAAAHLTTKTDSAVESG